MWQQLTDARRLYFACYHEERSPYFTTQYLSLEVVLRWAGRPAADPASPRLSETAREHPQADDSRSSARRGG